MEGFDEYKCMLDDQSLQKAVSELQEDPRERLGSVETLRQWVKQQKWIRSPTGNLRLVLHCVVCLF